VVISGHHIILRGLKTVGGESSIFIDPGAQDIVIENMEMTGYGRDSGNSMASAGLTGNRAIDEDAAVKFPDASFGPILDTKRIIIQRSAMHNPAFGSYPWDIAHPAGTAALLMYPTGGQIVVRYNSVYSTTNGLLDGPPNLSTIAARMKTAPPTWISGRSPRGTEAAAPVLELRALIQGRCFACTASVPQISAHVRRFRSESSGASTSAALFPQVDQQAAFSADDVIP